MPPVPIALSAHAAAALRTDLTNYNAQQIAARIGALAAAALGRNDPLPARMQLADATDQLATQIRLLLLAETLTVNEVNAALPTLGFNGAREAGMIAARGERWQATITLNAHQGIVVASDWLAGMQTNTRQLAADHVLGVGGASSTLRALLPPTCGKRVLDLGTGCGIQALAAARSGAASVVATDVSERALQLGAFNIALNDPPAPIELRRGSLFAPVAGETFDLVVSNPPFVITPQAAYDAGLPHFTYRDAGSEDGGDGLIWQLLSQLPAYLRAGGQAVMLANWELDENGEPLAFTCPPALDALLLQRQVQDPAEYSAMWLRDAGIAEGSELWERVYRAYLTDFANRGVAAIAFGYVFAAKTNAAGRAPLRARVQAAQAPQLTATEAWSLFATRRWLHAASDEELAAAHLVANPQLRVDHHYAVGSEQPTSLSISNPRGLYPQRRCDQVLAGFVSVCDGELSVKQIAGALAALLEEDETDMLRACLSAARELLQNGDAQLREHAPSSEAAH